jgi:hypothetical protein
MNYGKNQISCQYRERKNADSRPKCNAVQAQLEGFEEHGERETGSTHGGSGEVNLRKEHHELRKNEAVDALVTIQILWVSTCHCATVSGGWGNLIRGGLL